ncbi:Ntn hydrolase family protein [Paenibacillus guangzhouensis]|uniref:hypothetical protein n=1 Tax=Paenibacillus guangzhouensis TaxID=1473112 RepID=UPI0012668A4A|nr:hypothetical protein [Paenibacillus guangzhouensis]
MSFLSTVVTENYLTVMADRRATQLLPDGSYGDILDEDANKIIEVSKYSFLSFVGAVETAQSFMQVTKFEETIFTRRGIINEAKLQAWHLENQEILQQVPSSFQLIFGGLTTRDTYKVYSLDSKEGSLSFIEREVGKLNYTLYPSSFFKKEELAAEWFEDLVNSSTINSLEDMIRIQALLNDKIAAHDRSVNTKKTIFTINF